MRNQQSYVARSPLEPMFPERYGPFLQFSLVPVEIIWSCNIDHHQTRPILWQSDVHAIVLSLIPRFLFLLESNGENRKGLIGWDIESPTEFGKLAPNGFGL